MKQIVLLLHLQNKSYLKSFYHTRNVSTSNVRKQFWGLVTFTTN
jgi:hypothetical protein